MQRKDATKLAMHMTIGLHWQQHVRLQRYNYDTQGIEPIEFDKLEFTIRMPPKYEIAMQSRSGIRVTRQLAVTNEQAQKVESLETEEERQVYLLQLASAAGLQQEMLSEINERLRASTTTRAQDA